MTPLWDIDCSIPLCPTTAPGLFCPLCTTKATDFEFRNRWWIFGLIFGASYSLLFNVDHLPIGVRITNAFVHRLNWRENPTAHLVFGLAAAIMVFMALAPHLGIFLPRPRRRPAIGLLTFAVFLDIRWFYGGLVASPLLSWLAGLAIKSRTKDAAAAN